MSKIAQFYPQIRVAIYAIITAVLAAAVAFGAVTEAESSAYLGYLASGLGALGTLLALVNVKTSAPVVDTPAIAEQVVSSLQERANVTVREVQTHAANTVADLRRQAEQAFGEYR
ncbi:hypothetical protein [Rhodococcoides fascians]|uniref:hypothetical protein n=1 Tax=Rhodococcoides fascians TaxID=1828 RepID=UPI00055ED102|nr:hypothetical protein [Rhodococcus fascians]